MQLPYLATKRIQLQNVPRSHFGGARTRHPPPRASIRAFRGIPLILSHFLSHVSPFDATCIANTGDLTLIVPEYNTSWTASQDS
jgi:hypothetical protein